MSGNPGNPLHIGYSFDWHLRPCADRALGDADARRKPGQEAAVGAEQVHAVHGSKIDLAHIHTQDGLKALLYMDLADQIKRARRRAGLSQHQLATMVGVQQSGISHWESGKVAPELHNILKVAEVLKIAFSDLVPRVHQAADHVLRDPQVRRLVQQFSQLQPGMRDTISRLVELSYQKEQGSLPD